MGEIGFQVQYNQPPEPLPATLEPQVRNFGSKLILGQIARIALTALGLIWMGLKFILIYVLSIILTLAWGWVAFNLTVGAVALAIYLLIKLVF